MREREEKSVSRGARESEVSKKEEKRGVVDSMEKALKPIDRQKRKTPFRLSFTS